MPVIKAGRRLPQIIKERLKDTLIQLERKKIISKVDYPTDWVHNITIVEKPGGSLRICLDLKTLKFKGSIIQYQRLMK